MRNYEFYQVSSNPLMHHIVFYSSIIYFASVFSFLFKYKAASVTQIKQFCYPTSEECNLRKRLKKLEKNHRIYLTRSIDRTVSLEERAELAEKLKVKFGAALAEEVIDNRIITIPGFRGRDSKEVSEKNLSKIIEARVREIFDYVLWEIKRSGYENKLIAGIVLTGGGSLLSDIDELAENHTCLSTRIGQPIEHLAHGYSSMISSPIFSTAVGLLSIAIDNLQFIDYPVMDIKDEDTEDADIQKLEKAGNAQAKWYSKIFTYTKDFFEASPDSEF